METITILPRNKNQWITPQELRALLKNNLGITAKQASVKKGCGVRYLDITIRDPRLDFRAVEKFAKTLDTWSMDETDYCDGQSISVHLSDEVKTAMIQKYLHIAQAFELPPVGQCAEVLPGVYMCHADHNCYLWRDDNKDRSQYMYSYNIANKTPWAIEGFAYKIALLCA